MKTLLENLNEFLRLLRTMQLADMVDIALVTFLVYQGIQLIRSSSTARIAKAVVLLLLLSWVTDLLEIHVLNFLLDRVLELGLIALVVLFQPRAPPGGGEGGRRQFEGGASAQGADEGNQRRHFTNGDGLRGHGPGEGGRAYGV